MTNNTTELSSDGISLIVTFGIKAKRHGKILLSILLTAIISAFAFLFSKFTINGGAIIVMILVTVIIIVFPLRYLVWNIFGSEILVVNTKSISFQYNYGIFATQFNTIVYDRLMIEFEKVRDELDGEKGVIVFTNYRADTDLPEIIHTTTVLISQTQFNEIIDEIDKVFVLKYFEEFNGIGISMN